MRHLSLFTVAALVAAVATPALAQEETTGAPKLVVEQSIIDAGTVPQGKVLDIEFKLANQGTAPLDVISVRPTCGCTVADYDKQVPAGGTGSVKAHVDTTDFAGPISKSILLRTNDPDNPAMTLVIKSDVKPYIEVLPRKLMRFNVVQKDPAVEKVVVVGGADDDDFKVTGVDSSEDFLKATVRPLEGDERIAGKGPRQYEVSMAVAPDAPVGPVSGDLVVHTNHPKAPKVDIKVYGVVRALVHVTPPQIQFGSVESKLRPGRNVIVVNNRPGEHPLQLTKVSVDDPAFVASSSTIEEGRRYQVTVTVKDSAEAGAHDATLTIATNDPDYPTIEVPVRASLR